MATYSSLPGTLNVAFKRGDELGFTVDFDHSLAGYAISAVFVSVVTGATLATLTTNVLNEPNGTVSLSLSETQTIALPAGTLALRVTLDAPGSVRRTTLEGFVEAR